MSKTVAVMKTVSAGIFIGAIMAFFVTLIGTFVVFIYGVSHAPMNIHLSLFSQSIFDFASSRNQSFQMGFNAQGMFYMIVVLMLIGAALFWLFKGFKRQPS
mgnify:CR=1 FL=1